MALTAASYLATAAMILGFLQGGEHDAPFREALGQSSNFIANQDYEKAIGALLPLSSSHPNDYILNLRLGWLYYFDKKYDDSERFFAAMQSAPRAIQPKLALLLPLLANAKYDTAETIAKQIVDTDPANYYGNLRLAVALRLQSKTDDARAIIDRNLAKYPTDTYFLAESVALARAAPSTAANDADVTKAIGESIQYETALDYAKAIEAIAAPLKAHPRNYTLNLRSGWLHYLKAEYEKSERDYQQASRLAPKSIEAKLGVLLAMLGQEHYKNVEPLADQIIRTDRNNLYANLRLAIALRKLGKLAEAEKVARKMLAVYPANTLLMTELGLIEQAQNKTAAAKEVFLDVLALDPTNTTAKQQVIGAAARITK